MEENLGPRYSEYFFSQFLTISKDPSAKSKQSPKVPAKPRQKKETKALTALPVTVAAEKDSIGPEWYNDDDVQNLLPTEDRKRSKNQNPKAEEKRGMLNQLIAGLVKLQSFWSPCFSVIEAQGDFSGKSRGLAEHSTFRVIR